MESFNGEKEKEIRIKYTTEAKDKRRRKTTYFTWSVLHLDRLVRASGDQTRARGIKRRKKKHPRLGFQRAQLWNVVHVLEWDARVVVPKREHT